MRDAAESKAEFRVEKKKDLHRLAEALQIPGTLKCYQGTEIIPGKYLHATTTTTATTLFQYSHVRTWYYLQYISNTLQKQEKKIDQQFTWKVKCAQ